jgi:hypothetical protein
LLSASTLQARLEISKGVHMANWMPTEPGDVLILKTSRSFLTHAVGPVREHHQQDFRNQPNIRHVAQLSDAIAVSAGMLGPGGQIFLRNIDTGDWSTMSAMQRRMLRERRTA